MSALSFPLCVTALTLVLGGQIFAGQAVARDYGQQGAVWPVIEPDLLAAYASNLFGITCVALVKIRHVRPFKRELIIEAQAEGKLTS